jgi:phosphocarrier protein HPr
VSRALCRATDPHGLHARPAARFVKAMAALGVPVTVTKGERSADARSILEVLGLGVDQGSEFVVETDLAPEDLAAALSALTDLLEFSLSE